MRLRLFLLLNVLSLFCVQGALAAPQIPGLTSTPPAAASSQPATQPDALGRDNPRGCILGFIKAAQDQRYNIAAEYFEPSPRQRHESEEEEKELVNQLLAILNQKFAGALDFISRDPLGRLDDGLSPDQEKIGGVLGVAEPFPILLVRREDEQGHKIWLFSRQTLDQVPEYYDSLQFPVFEKKIPKTLVTHRVLSMPYWQWIAILLFIPVALALGRVITLLIELIVKNWRKSRHLPPLPPSTFRAIGPGTLAFAAMFHFYFVSYIGTSLLYRLYYRRILVVFLSVAFYWILIRLTRFLSARIGANLASRGRAAERSIVSLVRRFVEVVIFVFVTLVVLHSLGFDVTTALAGVGIGTLALGLGAQKTFENVFGGVSVLFDKVILVGDVCKVNNQTGVVEDIGLRSTRLRTGERTLLSIPNGIMASVTVENLRFRDKFLCQQTIRLRYDLSPDHVRNILEEIRRLLLDDPKVEDSSARVRLLRFGDYALEIELFCYILETDYVAYLASQEDLLLQVMATLEKSSLVIALPTQTTLVTQDSWFDSNKGKQAIDKIPASGAPTRP
ncbi:MAG TPA: mechanosensitive ion channel family protein [Candidatus Acidoferrum sp.]|jgi:MscS family membrane protein